MTSENEVMLTWLVIVCLAAYTYACFIWSLSIHGCLIFKGHSGYLLFLCIVN